MIPRHADLLHKTYLVVHIPDIYSHAVEGFRWVRGLGIAMLDRVILRAGGSVLQTLTREWLWIQSRYNQPLDKQDQWDTLVGNTPDIYSPKDPIKDEYPSSRPIEDLFYPQVQTNSLAHLQQRIRRVNSNSQPRVPSIVGRDLRIPLTFFFHQNVGKCLPLIAIQYADVEMEFHFRPYTELFTIRRAAQLIDDLRDTTSTNIISRDIRNALERDPPTPYISPASNYTSTISNGEPSSSNIVRYMEYGGAIQSNSWNLNVRVEADYIYLKEDERRLFALSSHEFLVDDIIQERRPISSGDVSVEYRIFHPVRQMFWWLQRDDTTNTNEWLNWTQFDSADPFLEGRRDSLKGTFGVAHDEYPIRAFQDTVEETLLGRDRIHPGEIWLQDEHVQRGIIPNFFLKGFFRSPHVADPTAQQCLHLLYRYGFRTRFGNWFLKRLQHATNVNHLAKLKKEAYEFLSVWKYRHPNDIPVIDRLNYRNYLEHTMESAVIRVHNHRDSTDEEKTADYWNLATAWSFHPRGTPLPATYCNSFALDPFADYPTGSLNASMIDSITIVMKVRPPPEERRITDHSYQVNPFINRRKIMSIVVPQGSSGNLTGNTIEYPLHPLTSLPTLTSSITDTFTISSNTSVSLATRTDTFVAFLQANSSATLSDYVPQEDISMEVEFGNYSYTVTAQEPTNNSIQSITWEGMVDDVVISNFEYFQESRLDYPQLVEKGNLLEHKDPIEIFNDAAVRRGDTIDATEIRGPPTAQWGYTTTALFHRWNIIRVENGLANRVFAN